MKSRKKKENARAFDSPRVAALRMHEARHYIGGISVPTMHRLIRSGKLVPVRKLRVLLFPIEELDRFLKT
jgi:hypothetical protein